MVLRGLSDRTSFPPRGIPREGGSRDAMSRYVVLPVAGVVDDGALATADSYQLLANQHRDSSMAVAGHT